LVSFSHRNFAVSLSVFSNEFSQKYMFNFEKIFQVTDAQKSIIYFTVKDLENLANAFHYINENNNPTMITMRVEYCFQPFLQYINYLNTKIIDGTLDRADEKNQELKAKKKEK